MSQFDSRDEDHPLKYTCETLRRTPSEGRVKSDDEFPTVTFPRGQCERGFEMMTGSKLWL